MSNKPFHRSSHDHKWREPEVPNRKAYGGSLVCTHLVGWGHPLAKSDEAARFYRRAEELRNIAANTEPQEARRTLLKLADDYELMAKRAELAKPRKD